MSSSVAEKPRDAPSDLQFSQLHTMSQKVPTFQLSETLSNLNRLSKFLYYMNEMEVGLLPYDSVDYDILHRITSKQKQPLYRRPTLIDGLWSVAAEQLYTSSADD